MTTQDTKIDSTLIWGVKTYENIHSVSIHYLISLTIG